MFNGAMQNRLNPIKGTQPRATETKSEASVSQRRRGQSGSKRRARKRAKIRCVDGTECRASMAVCVASVRLINVFTCSASRKIDLRARACVRVYVCGVRSVYLVDVNSADNYPNRLQIRIGNAAEKHLYCVRIVWIGKTHCMRTCGEGRGRMWRKERRVYGEGRKTLIIHALKFHFISFARYNCILSKYLPNSDQFRNFTYTWSILLLFHQLVYQKSRIKRNQRAKSSERKRSLKHTHTRALAIAFQAATLHMHSYRTYCFICIRNSLAAFNWKHIFDYKSFCVIFALWLVVCCARNDCGCVYSMYNMSWMLDIYIKTIRTIKMTKETAFRHFCAFERTLSSTPKTGCLVELEGKKPYAAIRIHRRQPSYFVVRFYRNT